MLVASQHTHKTDLQLKTVMLIPISIRVLLLLIITSKTPVVLKTSKENPQNLLRVVRLHISWALLSDRI